MTNNQHIEIFQATAQGTGWPTSVAISGSDWAFQVDEPEEDGGSNSGPNPLHHFLASLAGCQNEQAQVVAGELGIQANDIQFTIEVALNLAGFMGEADSSDGSFQEVKLQASVAGLSAEQASELGNRVDARCPILGLLRSGGATIQSTWVGK